MATIKLIRKKAWGDILRSYAIILDGKKVGAIRHGKTCSLNCSTGQHSLQLKIDWCRSPEVFFEILQDNDSLEFECQSNVNPLKVVKNYLLPEEWISLVAK